MSRSGEGAFECFFVNNYFVFYRIRETITNCSNNANPYPKRLKSCKYFRADYQTYKRGYAKISCLFRSVVYNTPLPPTNHPDNERTGMKIVFETQFDGLQG